MTPTDEKRVEEAAENEAEKKHHFNGSARTIVKKIAFKDGFREGGRWRDENPKPKEGMEKWLDDRFKEHE